jgi:hypothetical protein
MILIETKRPGRPPFSLSPLPLLLRTPRTPFYNSSA